MDKLRDLDYYYLSYDEDWSLDGMTGSVLAPKWVPPSYQGGGMLVCGCKGSHLVERSGVASRDIEQCR